MSFVKPHYGELQMKKAILTAVAALVVAGSANAAIVLTESFSAAPAPGTFIELIEGSAANAEIVYAFDYATLSIPSAPRSTGGSTTGLSLRSNISAAAVSTVGVYTSASYSGDYQVTVDVYPYLNPAGPTGTSEYANFGINHSGTRQISFQQAVSTSTDGYWLTFRTDASANDSIIFQEGFTTAFSDNEYPGLVWADSSDGSVAGGARKGNATPFAQSFFGAGGVFVNQWKTIQIKQEAGIVTASIDGAPLFTRNDPDDTWTSGRVLLGGDDPFASVNADIRVIYDNLLVETIVASDATNWTSYY